MDMEEYVAVGDILGIPASLDDDDVTIPCHRNQNRGHI